MLSLIRSYKDKRTSFKASVSYEGIISALLNAKPSDVILRIYKLCHIPASVTLVGQKASNQITTQQTSKNSVESGACPSRYTPRVKSYLPNLINREMRNSLLTEKGHFPDNSPADILTSYQLLMQQLTLRSEN